jgi:Sensors of blue-light using FAD
MYMSQLIYYSEKRDLGRGGVDAILEKARSENQSRSLTGLLMFNRKFFLQCLEGGREAVTTTFCKIAADPRHGNVTLISVHQIDARDFPDWTMGYVVSTSEQMKSALREFQPTDEFNPRLLTSSSAINLMKRMRSMELTV